MLLNGEPLPEPPPPRHDADGKLELVAIESADPRWIGKAIDGLQSTAHRIRAMGTIAVSLCQVALTRVDGMATLWSTRSVDAAAAQLVVRESGGVVAFPRSTPRSARRSTSSPAARSSRRGPRRTWSASPRWCPL